MVAPWLFVGGIEHGRHVVRLTLNANDHATYARRGKPLEARTTVVAPKKATGHGGS
jgi:lysozyme family protein